MRLAVIGGTAFIGRHFVQQALAAGHDLTVFHRGQTNQGLWPDVTEILGDRNDRRAVAQLATQRFDALIDTCAYLPRQVDLVAEVLGDCVDSYLLVSSVSVYRPSVAPVTLEDGALFSVGDLADPHTEVIDDVTYGPLKVICESAAQAAFASCTVVRPTYVVGPYDGSDRFTWWVRRIAEGGPVLAAEPADGPIQVIDVRDLAAFMLRLVEQRTAGVFNGAGPVLPVTWRQLFSAVAEVCAGPEHEMVWAEHDWLADRGIHVAVDLPMWACDDEASILRASVDRATAAGLRLRPLAETIADLRAWDVQRGLPPLKSGLSPERHAELLAQLS